MFLGTALLLAAVVGSGIMGERLAAGNVAIALLANTIATGAALQTPPCDPQAALSEGRPRGTCRPYFTNDTLTGKQNAFPFAATNQRLSGFRS